MLNLDLLKIQKTIEDFRLKFALKFAKFLTEKLKKIQQFLFTVFSSNNFVSFAIIFLALISICAQTNRDIAGNSAFNLQILLQNNDNFFTTISSFNFYLFLPTVFLAKIFNISLVLSAIVFINFLGILSIFFVKKIIENSDVFAEKLLKNLLILSFSLAFFLQPFALISNDFFNKESLLLVFLLPYLALWIASSSCRSLAMTTRSSLRFSSISPRSSLGALQGEAWQSRKFFLAILIILINPFFAILVLTIEIFDLIKKEILWQKFLIKLMATFAVVFLYFYFQKSYLNNLFLLFPNYLESAFLRFRMIFREGFLPIIYFICASWFLLRNDKILQKFYLIFLAVFLTVFFDIFSDFSASFLILNLSLPLILLSFYLLVKNDYFDFKKYGIFLLVILLISQFDAKNIFSLALDISSFFFVFIIYFRFSKKRNLDDVFYPKSLKNILIFSGISLLIITAAFYQKFAFFSWFLSSLIFANFIYFAQEKFAKDKLNLLSAGAILLALSYLISLNLEAFIKKPSDFLTEEIIKISKKNLAEDENLIIISNDNLGANSLIYLQKENLIKVKNLGILFSKKLDCRALHGKARNDEDGFFCENKGREFLLENLIRQLQNKNNKLIFIKNSNSFCEISFLEQLLRRAEFSESFLKNYQFFNRIIKEEEFEKINFFKNEAQMESKLKFKKIINDFEIYIAK